MNALKEINMVKASGLREIIATLNRPEYSPFVYAAGGGAIGWFIDKLRKKKGGKGAMTGALIGGGLGLSRYAIHKIRRMVLDNLKERSENNPRRLGKINVEHMISRDPVGSKAGTEFTVDEKGRAGITPRQARRNLYQDAFLKERGDKYSKDEAIRAADEDMAKAMKKRHEKIVEKHPFAPQSVFDKNTNYAIMPHSSYVGGHDAALSYGSLDSSIPLVLDHPRGMTWGRYVEKVPEEEGVLEKINIGLMGKPYHVLLHEGAHSFTPMARYGGRTTFWGPEGDRARDTSSGVSGYASGPAEAMVAISNEKAKMRAAGDKGGNGMGLRWAKKQIENMKKVDGRNSLEESVYGEGEHENAMNVKSLRRILFDLYKNRNTVEGAKKYKEFLDSLNYYFEVAKNSRRRSGSRAIA